MIGSTALKLLAELDAKIYVGFGRLQEKLHLYPIARALSFTGDGYFYVLLATIATYFSPEVATKLWISALAAFAVELPLYWILKKYFRRQRPYVVVTALERIHIPSDEFSFPSGHSTAAFLMAYLVSHFFPPLTLFMYSWALMIAFSRVLLRVCLLYTSDAADD